MAEQNNQKVSYTKCAFDTDKDGNITGNCMVEGFAKRLQIMEVTKDDGTKQNVAHLEISSVIGDKSVAKMWGQEFVNEYHNVRFRISYWGFTADDLAKYPPQVNQKVVCLVKGASVKPNKRESNGKTYLSIDATGVGNPYTNSSRKDDGQSCLVAGNNQPAAAKTAAAPAATKKQEPIFEEIDDDSDLPF